jgi:hypothetical protein
MEREPIFCRPGADRPRQEADHTDQQQSPAPFRIDLHHGVARIDGHTASEGPAGHVDATEARRSHEEHDEAGDAGEPQRTAPGRREP